MQEPPPLRPARWSVIATLLGAAALGGLPVALFYPGLMNADSLNMYGNARNGGPASDWHSPFLVWLWRGLFHLGFEVAALTALHGMLYALALAWLLMRARLRPPARLALLAAILLTPPILTWLAALEKTTIAACLLTACFAIAVALDARARRQGAGLGLALVGLALAGVWCRPNGIAIFAPVVAYTAWRQWPGTRLRGTAVLAGFVVLALAAPMLGGRFGLVERRYPEQEFFALDLMNLSLESGRDLMPPGALTVPFPVAAAAMREQPSPPFGGRFAMAPLRRNGMAPRTQDAAAARALRTAWWHAVQDNPGLYVRYRLAFVRAFACTDPAIVCYDSWHWYTGGIDRPNRFGLSSHAQPEVFAFYRSLAGSVAYRPFFHALVALALLALALWQRRGVVAVYAATLLAYVLSVALIAPGLSVRMVVPLGLMAPALAIGLFAAPRR